MKYPKDDDTVIIYLPRDRVTPEALKKLRVVELQKQLLDLVYDLWPANTRATVTIDQRTWNRIRRTLLNTVDALEEK